MRGTIPSQPHPLWRGRTALLAAIILFAGLAVVAPPVVQAATVPSGFTQTTIDGLNGPTAMALAPDGRVFVAEGGGRLRIIKNGVLLATPFVTVPVNSEGERGLLGVALDPDFATNQFVYINYTAPTDPPHNVISRFTANGDVAQNGSQEIILELDNQSAIRHVGGAIHFGPDEKLYVATGDNGNSANAQSLNTRWGKILRVNRDGTIPTDNPFFNTTTGHNRAIWALGLRNPFTFAFQPGTGRMFINDVGQDTWEEINEGTAGGNYGWPATEGPTSNPDFIGPVFAYEHEGPVATTGCAITGGAFYNPSQVQFEAHFVGDYFFADFCSGWVRRYDRVEDQSFAFATGFSSPVDLKVGNDGSLYVLSRGAGTVTRIQRSTTGATCDGRPATIVGSGSIQGTSGPDVIVGSAGDDTIAGRGGADVICAGSGNDIVLPGAGSDIVDGQAGIDTVSYEHAPQGVVVKLGEHSATGQGTDTLASLENVVGSAFADRLRGDGGANRLEGLGGHDRLFGAGGADRLEGGSGNDALDGGAGTDTCLQQGGTGATTSCEA